MRFLLERISYYWHWIPSHLIRLGPSHGIAVLFDNISQEVCFLGRKFFSPPGQSLSSEGVGCSGGSVWLEHGKREKRKKRRWCLRNKLRRKRSFMIKLIVSTYLHLRRIIFPTLFIASNSPPKKKRNGKKERKEKNRLTSQTPSSPPKTPTHLRLQHHVLVSNSLLHRPKRHQRPPPLHRTRPTRAIHNFLGGHIRSHRQHRLPSPLRPTLGSLWTQNRPLVRSGTLGIE